jgi:hypothetical protein
MLPPYGAVNPNFLSLQLLAEPFQYVLNKMATGLTAKGIKAAKLMRLPIALPPLAAAFSLSAFANSDSNSFSTSDLNLLNLQQGIDAANILVNSLTGVVNPSTPDKHSLPVAKINTMADILAGCVRTTGASIACNTLFAAARSPGAAYPTNTFQAALAIAENVNQNVGTIYSLLPAPASVAFQPTLTSSPTDWAIIPATIPTVTTIQPVSTQIYSNGATSINIHVNCNSACGIVELRYDGQDRFSAAPVDSNGDY